jgi:hypothetical protein
MRVCVRGGKSADEWKQSARHVGHSPGRSHNEVSFGHSIFFKARNIHNEKQTGVNKSERNSSQRRAAGFSSTRV